MKNTKYMMYTFVCLSLISSSVFSSFGGGCGDGAIFQIDNSLSESFTVENISGDISVMTTDVAEGKVHIGTISSKCNTQSCTINTGSFTAGDCSFQDIEIQVQTKGSITPDCSISNHQITYASSSSSTSCSITFDSESGSVSYPTMYISPGNSQKAALLNYSKFK